MPDFCPSVSLVINTLNRANYLNDAITGVFQIDYPKFELIVVNGPSTDHTLAVLDPWKDKVKIRQCDVPNLSVSRNIGISAASGDIVAFLDDDAVPHPTWLNRLVPHYADSRVGGVGGFTVDNTGVRWQVRKTICDRYGNAHFVDDFFDERKLNVPRSPFYPSLLGTNSSFRRSALHKIGGFDHTFAYLLDETDVCLRLVDAGWHILYEQDALIFHQFAESHVRSQSRKPRTLYPSVVSKTYFINHHGGSDDRSRQALMLDRYEHELRNANRWLENERHISPEHRVSLDLDLEQGLDVGARRAIEATAKTKGDLDTIEADSAFLPIESPSELRVVLVSQGYPPNGDAGIARWTHMLACGLAKLGVRVHVITRSNDGASRRFQDGIWLHRIPIGDAPAASIAQTYNVPEPDHARWMAAVMHEIRFIKTFGLDLVSFPIWDLEALPALDDPDLACVMSLHTTYLLARPFKPEWNLRVIYGRKVIDRVINAEKATLERAPFILANSETIVAEIEQNYGVSLSERYRVVPHGTADLVAESGQPLAEHLKQKAQRAELHILFPGRFELRKGYDLALQLAQELGGKAPVKFHFVGQRIDPEVVAKAFSDSAVAIGNLSNATFHGEVSRGELNQLFLDADFVLMPSRFESFGLVAIEAMSAGVPVVALANAALNEVVEHETSGWLYDEASYVASAKALLRSMASDRASIKRYSHLTYDAYQRRFTDLAMAKEILSYYRSAVAAKAGA